MWTLATHLRSWRSIEPSQKVWSTLDSLQNPMATCISVTPKPSDSTSRWLKPMEETLTYALMTRTHAKRTMSSSITSKKLCHGSGSLHSRPQPLQTISSSCTITLWNLYVVARHMYASRMRTRCHVAEMRRLTLRGAMPQSKTIFATSTRCDKAGLLKVSALSV